MTNKYHYSFYLIIVGVIFFLMNIFTPLSSDDWHYNFIFNSQNHIKTIGDILYSQYLHYFNFNGRFIPHFFIQLFDGILGKSYFNIANTIMFVVFLLLLSLTLRKYYSNYFISSTLALLFLFFLLPGFNNCFLWMSGACNYLWVGVFVLIFDILLKSDIKDWRYYPLLFLWGLFCGWTNEAIVLGLGIGYFIYYMIHNKEIRMHKAIMLVGLYIGIALLIFSPGSINRALGNNTNTPSLSDSLHNLISSLLNMDNIRLLPILILLLFILFMINRKDLKKVLTSNLDYICAIFISFLFILWTRHDSAHSRFGFEFFSLLLILKLISYININKWMLVFCNIALLCCSIYALFIMQKNYNNYKNCISQIADNKQIILTDTIDYIPFFNRFIVYFNYPETSIRYNPYNVMISNHFRKDQLCFFPSHIYHAIQSGSDQFNSFHINDKQPFYIKKIDSDKINHVYFILNETNYEELPFYIRPFAKKMGHYTLTKIETTYYSIIKLLGNRYLIVNKNMDFDYRVKEISTE